jgi:phospholipase/carboxylesterase
MSQNLPPELQSARKGAPVGAARQIVVFVHGYGADGADLISLADALAPHMPQTAFYAPDAPQPCAASPFGRQWFPIPRFDGSSEAAAKAGMQAAALALNQFVDGCLQREGLGPDRLVLLGFSQGAMMSLHIAPRRDAAIAGVVAISGKLIDPDALALEAKVKPEVLLIHGDHDDVVPFEEMHLAGAALQASGFATYAHVMAGTGHGIAPDGLSVALSFMAQRLGL